jgi:hypothetical protein
MLLISNLAVLVSLLAQYSDRFDTHTDAGRPEDAVNLLGHDPSCLDLVGLVVSYGRHDPTWYRSTGQNDRRSSLWRANDLLYVHQAVILFTVTLSQSAFSEHVSPRVGHAGDSEPVSAPRVTEPMPRTAPKMSPLLQQSHFQIRQPTTSRSCGFVHVYPYSSGRKRSSDLIAVLPALCIQGDPMFLNLPKGCFHAL